MWKFTFFSSEFNAANFLIKKFKNNEKLRAHEFMSISRVTVEEEQAINRKRLSDTTNWSNFGINLI